MGVPQGSIMGPLFWNLVHDGLLKELKTIPLLNAVTLVDDLAGILNIAKQDEATLKWCVYCGLRIARD